MIASDDDATRKEEEEGDDDNSRQGSVEDGRTATATTLGIPVCLFAAWMLLFIWVSMVLGLLGVVIKSSDGWRGEEKRREEVISKRMVCVHTGNKQG